MTQLLPLQSAGVSEHAALVFPPATKRNDVSAMNKPGLPFESSALELVGIVRRYCDLIDGSGSGDDDLWLRDVASVLPRLQAAVTSFESEGRFESHRSSTDLDARFELFSRLRTLLAGRDGYWLEYDRAHDGDDGMSGSLADDLTDIYCELKHGLHAFDTDPKRALDAWCVGYECHWGQHLVDAQRHLSSLAAKGRID